MKITTAFHSLVALLYPRLCAACDRPCDEGSSFCASCAISVDPIGEVCPRCGVPIANARGPCVGCQLDAPPYDRSRSSWLFGGSVAVAIRRCKYGDRPEIFRSLGRRLPPIDDSQAVIIPIPLHRKRLQERGYNQSALLALSLGRTIDVKALERVRDTPPQAGLKAEARRRNVAGAFLARPDRVRGRHVILVDDVITTGATIESASTELRRAGASRIDVLTLARAVT
jgi:ComF family protein